MGLGLGIGLGLGLANPTPNPNANPNPNPDQVGVACGLPEGMGVMPGEYCEPKMTTVGSQDTTGPMTRDELKDLACLGFSADLVMQAAALSLPK